MCIRDSVFAKELEACTAQYNGCVLLDDVMSALLHYERVMTLVYDVEFAPRERKELCVSYLATGTMDQMCIRDRSNRLTAPNSCNRA